MRDILGFVVFVLVIWCFSVGPVEVAETLNQAYHTLVK